MVDHVTGLMHDLDEARAEQAKWNQRVDALQWALDLNIEREATAETPANTDRPFYEDGYGSTIRPSELKHFQDDPVDGLLFIAQVNDNILKFTQGRRMLEHAGVVDNTKEARDRLWADTVRSERFADADSKGEYRVRAQDGSNGAAPAASEADAAPPANDVEELPW